MNALKTLLAAVEPIRKAVDNNDGDTLNRLRSDAEVLFVGEGSWSSGGVVTLGTMRQIAKVAQACHAAVEMSKAPANVPDMRAAVMRRWPGLPASTYMYMVEVAHWVAQPPQGVEPSRQPQPPHWGAIGTEPSGKVELWPAAFRSSLDRAFMRGVAAAQGKKGGV